MTKVRYLPVFMLIMCLGLLTHWLALIGPQVINGPDIKIHFRWALQFAAALSEGVPYPRWASYSYFGLGDPTFLYVHPIFYYVVAAFYALIGNFWVAVLAVGSVGTTATAALTFIFVRRHTSDGLAIAATIAMAISPYAFHLAHFQQFLPMHFAMPFLVFHLGIISFGNGRNRISLTAVSLALLIMCHVLVAFMALICTAPIVLWRAIRERETAWNLLMQHGLGVLLGLALAAIYLLPALTTQHLVSPDGWYAPIHLDWRNAFLLQYFTLPAFGFRWFHLQWTIPLLTVLVCVLSCCFLWISKSEKNVTWWRALEMLIIALTALLLGSEITYPLWEHVEVLRRLQFPLRFLQVASIASVFGLAWSASCLRHDRREMVRMAIGAFLVISLTMLGALERQFMIEAKPALDVASPARTLVGQPEMKPAGAGKAWRKYIDEGGWEAECRNLQLTCTTKKENTHRKIWQFLTNQNINNTRLPIFWFPGWELLINGKSIIPTVDKETGLPEIELQPGTTVVEANWVGIPQEQVGFVISLLSLITIIGLSMTNRSRHKQPDPQDVA